MSKKLTVQIQGTRYAITTTEDPDYVQGLAQEIDSLVHSMMLGTSVSANQALLLSSLHFLDLYKKADQGADHLRRQISQYDKEASKARSELFEAKKELSKLRQGRNDDKQK